MVENLTNMCNKRKLHLLNFNPRSTTVSLKISSAIFDNVVDQI